MNFSSLLKRSALAAVLLAIAALPMSSGVKREVRSVWMATVWALDWPSSTSSTTAQKNEMVKYLDVLQKNNFNAVYFQVRTMSDAFYKSSYEPWSSYLTGTRGKDPGWDPLAFVVEECHKRGMECHAWVNPYRFSTGSNWSTAQDQALKSAGMLLAYTKSDGKTTTILNPGLESVRKRIVDVCKEIISNYDVDGLVFDDYFYPEGIPVTSSAGDYDLWQKSGASMTFGDWRRNNVNQMVADVYKMVQHQKPYVRFGISPAGAACTSAAVAAKHGIDRCPVASDWQYDGIFSDPVAWLEAGTIDYLSAAVLENQPQDQSVRTDDKVVVVCGKAFWTPSLRKPFNFVLELVKHNQRLGRDWKAGAVLTRLYGKRGSGSGVLFSGLCNRQEAIRFWRMAAGEQVPEQSAYACN